jgi:hypothetical protein
VFGGGLGEGFMDGAGGVKRESVRESERERERERQREREKGCLGSAFQML